VFVTIQNYEILNQVQNNNLHSAIIATQPPSRRMTNPEFLDSLHFHIFYVGFTANAGECIGLVGRNGYTKLSHL